MSQLSLFGESSPSSPDGLEAMPDPDPSINAIAAELPPELRLGTCSWTFPGWDVVYRRRYRSDREFRRESLAEYANFPLFRAVEVDSTYYAPPTASQLRNMLERAGELEFALKVWSELTTFVFPRHARFRERAGMRNPHFLSVEMFEQQILAPIKEAGFGPLGPLILEIPPIPSGASSAKEIEEALARFLSQAPEGYRYAVELRNPSLLGERHAGVLRDHGAAHVYSFHPKMPPLKTQRQRFGLGHAPFAIARLMLPPGRTYGEQKERFEPFNRIHDVQHEMRREVLSLIQDAGARGLPTYVFCNNKAEGSSPLTALALAKALTEPNAKRKTQADENTEPEGGR